MLLPGAGAVSVQCKGCRKGKSHPVIPGVCLYGRPMARQLKKMYTCIGQLEATDRLIITMILEGMDYGEIADIVGITGDTLRVRIHRIKKKLTNCVQL